MKSNYNVTKERFFTDQEYARRLKLTRERMDAAGIEVLLIIKPTNICYLTGFFSLNLWDSQILILPLESEPSLVLWEFEGGRFHTSSCMGLLHTYRLQENPLVVMAGVLLERGLGKRRIGIESPNSCLSSGTHCDWGERLGSRSIQDGSGVVESVRLVKSQEEIGTLRRSAAIGSAAMNAALRLIQEGAIDREIAAEALRVLIREGSEPLSTEPIVVSGSRAAIPHSTYNGSRIESADAVLVELGASFARYTAPMMRTAAAGSVSGEIRRLRDASLRTLDALTHSIRSGVQACEVARRGRQAMAHVESEALFHHVFGLPVGLGFPPSWAEESNFLISENNSKPLETGMVFHLPISLRVPGQYGVGFSETVLVTETGCEVLTHADDALAVK